MKFRRFRWPIFFAVVLLLVFAFVVVPNMPADYLRGPIEGGLRRALNREVRIGAAHYVLLPRPGFELEDAVIDDDPAIGPEPLAYVTTLTAYLRLASLLKGEIEFSELSLEDPSINLVKREGGDWNVRRFFREGQPAQARPGGRPGIKIRDGRLNFKFGEVKSSFFLQNVDLDLTAQGDGSVAISFEGQPSRTDHTVKGFGTLSADGYWRPGGVDGGTLDLDLVLERGLVAELVQAVAGNDFGLQGRVASYGRLTGPLSQLQLKGQFRFDGLHGSSWLPFQAETWTLDYRGSFDAASDSVVVETLDPKGTKLPLSFRVRAWDLLRDVKWASLFSLRDVAGYSPPNGLQGRMDLNGGKISFGGSGQTWEGDVNMVFSGNEMDIEETNLATGKGDSVALQAAWRPTEYYVDVQVKTPRLSLGELKNAAASADNQAIPFLDRCTEGTLAGSLRYRRQGDVPGSWTGAFRLMNALVNVEGVAGPVAIQDAQITLSPGSFHLAKATGEAHGLEFTAGFSYTDLPGAGGVVVPQARVDVHFASASFASLERLLEFSSRPESFLSRTFRFARQPLPGWLRSRHLEGSLGIGELSVGPLTATNVRSNVTWNGENIALRDLRANLRGGRLFGSLDVGFGAAGPEYNLPGYIEDIETPAGKLSAEFDLRAAGSGNQLPQSLKCNGTIEARGLEMSVLPRDAGAGKATPSPEDDHHLKAPETVMLHDVFGGFTVTAPRGTPIVRLAGLQAELGASAFSGSGRVQPDGHLEISLLAEERPLRLSSWLVPRKGPSPPGPDTTRLR
jgi:AsmA family